MSKSRPPLPPSLFPARRAVVEIARAIEDKTGLIVPAYLSLAGQMRIQNLPTGANADWLAKGIAETLAESAKTGDHFDAEAFTKAMRGLVTDIELALAEALEEYRRLGARGNQACQNS